MIEIPCLYEAFSQVMREARLEAGLSQEDLAKNIRCARSFISALENRNYQPTLNAFVAMSIALGVSPAEMMGRVEKKLAFINYLNRNDNEDNSDPEKSQNIDLPRRPGRL